MTETSFPRPRANMGQPVQRYEARAKVTGGADYPSDVRLARTVHAYIHTSRVARGTIRAFDLASARGVAGVIDILTHETVGDSIRQVPAIFGGGYASDSVRPLGSPEIAYWGQPVAVVLAETYEAAREASQRIVIDYAGHAVPAAADIDAERSVVQALEPMAFGVGDFEAAYASAAVTVDARYSTPAQHQNPMELFATQCIWEGDRLTVYEPSQYVNNVKFGLAEQLGIDAERIRVISTYVGGAFGAKGFLTQRTALVAVAARRLGRPVKLVATRAQGFTVSGYRAETRHHIQLGAERDGRLTAMRHEGWELTSRADQVAMGAVSMTARLYACPNIVGRVNAVAADRSTPGFMRAPGEMPYAFALESALDELAHELGLNPVELRRLNDTRVEPIAGLPYTSRSLMRCFDEAAARFGWSDRTSQPGSMRDGDWRVGWGCASAFYPAHAGNSSARVRLSADGRVHVSSAGHELGQGMYTMMAQVAAEELGVPVAHVTVSLGDTDLPPAVVAGGSASTASVAPAIMAACDAIRRRLGVENAPRSGVMPAMEASGIGVIEEFAETLAHGNPPESMHGLYRGRALPSGGAHLADRVQFAFGAQFVEVRVHALTSEIRVARAVGAFAAGRIINPRTAHGQLVGGMIWGIGSALHEHSEIDPRNASYINANLADYLVPVNADIVDVQAILVPEEDELVNRAGVKGVGEVGVVGMAAAISNAIFHATGRRLRDLPIRIEHLQ
ncbi:xanthine dehydrogenase YagR molybdenum-binding subunit [Aureimonas altamirensis DSM 21988]|uniref:Xanthine dehydrogenase YagR molybdenum-binding subunit n=1 Tax=Aureimonas altamirensis DSM 21988 TaxID=1121026 RepID=A0ABY1IPH8_9HYPH|nr:xanthine dehydrogenase family protein molybdopterin-binding subunit [Aureimonas altamirensis]SHJ77778.1 xanthine dehydrogenase YagR molybdenum-binding subunit [Aureimonas altamirensis DSM 21988]